MTEKKAPLEEGQRWNLLRGDCLDVLKTIPDNTFDSVVTDPPSVWYRSAHASDRMRRVRTASRTVAGPDQRGCAATESRPILLFCLSQESAAQGRRRPEHLPHV